eukprot:259727-Chlamydomonas_euryale.AAC.5
MARMPRSSELASSPQAKGASSVAECNEANCFAGQGHAGGALLCSHGDKAATAVMYALAVLDSPDFRKMGGQAAGHPPPKYADLTPSSPRDFEVRQRGHECLRGAMHACMQACMPACVHTGVLGCSHACIDPGLHA